MKMKAKSKFLNLAKILICTLIVEILPNGFCNDVDQANPIIVDAGELGLIQGAPLLTMGPARRPFYSYFNLRYAKAPIESQRFQPSERFVGNLSGTDKPFLAMLPGMSCSQPMPLPQSEDCLNLNVHTPRHPQSNETSLLPVIFFIHGGAFTAGMGSIYTGYRLLTKDVVLVGINYRLGAFGFLYFGTDEVPGNAGISDMINALEWTRDYIKYFGGDPNRITIAGQSSGSVAVTLLMSSPKAHGLFQGAIGNSGSSLAKWGIASDPIKSSLRVAALSNCTVFDDPTEEQLKTIAACMQTKPKEVIVDALYAYQTEERKEGRLGFDPVSAVIQSFESPEFEPKKVITKHPKQVFEDGEQANVPMMTGTTRHDGSYVLGVLYNRFLLANDYVNDTEFISKQFIPKILDALDINTEFGVVKAIEEVYLGDVKNNGKFFDIYPAFIDLLSVFFFKAPGYQTALYHSKKNQTYWYSMDYQGAHTMFYAIFGLEEAPPFRGGIAHGDDLIYLFMTSLDLNAADSAIAIKMVDYWFNFVSHGAPTQNATLWPSLNESEDDPIYLSIGEESVPSKNYETSWSGIGWEVLPVTGPPPTTSTQSPSSEPPGGGDEDDDNGGGGGSSTLSFNIYLLILSVSIKTCMF